MRSVQKLAMLLLLAVMAVLPFSLVHLATPTDLPSAAAQPALPSGVRWSATAPGKVEPRDGEYRLAPAVAGRIVEVAARPGDRVMEGDLLVWLDDQELVARLAGAAADVAMKKAVRDEQGAPNRAKRRYDADDAAFAAEQRLAAARLALDQISPRRRDAGGGGNDITAARAQLREAEAELARTRAAASDVHAAQGAPDPTANETALIVARSQWSALQAMLDQTRLRAPIDGSVIAMAARPGEIAAPAAPEALVIMGDLTRLRVRAEVDGRDIAKVRNGQLAAVRVDTFPDKEFSGRVTAVAPALLPGKLSPRGPRRAGDVDVLEIIITLDGSPPLLPGLRVDVFFIADQAAPAAERL